MIHSKRQKWVSILFSFVVMCVTAILGFVGLLQSAKPFSVLADDETATTATYAKVTSAPDDWSGEYLIVYEKYSVIFDGSLSSLDATGNYKTVTIGENTIEDNDIAASAFTIKSIDETPTTGGNYSIQSKSGNYIGRTANSNGFNSSTTTVYSNTISLDGTSLSINGQYCSLQYYASQSTSATATTFDRFRYYKSSQKAIALYKKVEACAHKDLEDTGYTPNADGKTHTETGTCASCGEKNVTKTVDCVATGELNYNSNGDGTHTKSGKCACGRVMEGTSEACSMREETVQYTQNADGTHTKHGTCVCEYEISDEAVACTYTDGKCVCERTAPKYTVTYSVWGETKATDEATLGIRYTLKTAADFSFSASYGTFVGWTTENVETSTSIKPTTYTEYDVTAAVTFYAVFSATQGSGDYIKVTAALEDWSGEYLIVYEAGNVAFNGALTKLDDTNNIVGVTIADNKISSTSELENSTFTIAAMDDGYSIQSKSGYYIGQTSSSNGLKSSLTSKYTNTISISNGTVSIQSSGTTLKYNNASNQNRFRYYASGQKTIELYKKDGTTDYYTKRAAAIVSASGSLDGDISMNYFAQVWDDSVSSLQMRFTVGEGTPTVVDGVKQTDGRYKFTLSLTPQCMADNIRAELWNGEACIDVKDGFSVREYAKTLLEDEESSDKLKALLSAMLRYGAAAQSYRNYNTEDLATSGVEDLLTTASATEIPEASFSLVKAEDVTKDDCAVWFKGAGIRFDSENKIYVRLSGALPEGYTLTCDGVEMTASADGYFYTAAISPIAYGNNYEFVLKNGDKVLQTLSGCINACLFRAANATGATDAEKELALALYNYGMAAAAYKA